MLEYLRIRDLALIENAELDFTSGMNALTGETGAGKTFILKAIQFLLGEKLSADMVRKGSKKAQVEAVFYIGGEEYCIRRELLAESGRSRFFLNDNLASQGVVKELRPQLILHVGQHGQQRLLQTSFQAKLVDDFLEDKDILNQKNEAHKALKQILSDKKDLLEKILGLQDKRELLEMQQREIEKVDPEEGEEDTLESMRKQYRSFEYLQETYEKGLGVLHGDGDIGLFALLSQLARVLENLVKEEELSKNISVSHEALLNFQEEMKALDALFRSAPTPETDLDLSLDDIEARLYELAQLKRKLNRSLPQILALKDEVDANLSFLDACSLDKIRLEKAEKAAVQNLTDALEKLNHAREIAAQNFCSALQEELKGLGFSEKVSVIPDFQSHILYTTETSFENAEEDKKEPINCIEKTVRLLWAPNPGQAPQPLDKIASGGELSRFLLAVIGLQKNQSEDATLIFDEVDAGVGGITLNHVADRLSQLAEKRQMLLITHWPQLAARAKNHFFISKEFIGDETFSRCVRLDPSEKEQELVRMAGGEKLF